MSHVQIALITYTKSKNGIGDNIKTPVKRTIFARKISISQTEFYQAQATGLKPAFKFEIRLQEYDKEQYLEFEKNTYKIIRSYEAKKDFIEIVCEGVVNTNG